MAMPRSRRKFDIDEFVRECLEAWEADGADAVKLVLDRTLRRGCAPVRECFGDPREAHLQVLYAGPELVIENMVWAPGMSYPAHNHNTPVMTGVYAGLEVNDFYHQIGPRTGGRLQRTKTVDINEGQAVLMAHDAIHRIANPNRRTFTGAFHIYMGDYLHSSRSIWYPDEASEKPASFALTKDIFAAANRDLAAARAADAEQDAHKKKSSAGIAASNGPGSGSGAPSGSPSGHAHGAPHPAPHPAPHAPARGPSRRSPRAPLRSPGDQG
jgi:predicted metal-dependent enzyme (double-stranded beta helix superfamily)